MGSRMVLQRAAHLVTCAWRLPPCGSVRVAAFCLSWVRWLSLLQEARSGPRLRTPLPLQWPPSRRLTLPVATLALPRQVTGLFPFPLLLPWLTSLLVAIASKQSGSA